MEPNFTGAPQDTAEFDQIMAESESCFHHRRAFSHDSFDDLLHHDFEFESNLFEFDMPNPPPAVLLPVDSMSSEESKTMASMPGPVGPTVGLDRGKSVDSNNLDGIGVAGDGGHGRGNNKVGRRRRHSISVDASWMLSFEGAAVSLAKKAMDSEQLAQLARVDPKRVKRILANRQSAAKSKERKTHYASELQEKVQLLRTTATDLATNVSILERETTGMAVRIKELRLRVEAMRQNSKIKNALSEALREEVRSLRIETDHLDVMLSNPSIGGILSQCSSQLAQQQFHISPYQQRRAPQQQFHIPPSQQHLAPLQQTQINMPNPLPPSSQSFSGLYDLNFSNFNQMD